ncbi:MAG: Homocysteine S-methyltransferase [Ignavibacteriaceae bacterium]|nr:Homocysteine S-methyltransferase [Ignavibacteriaceae bacterium]
MITTNPFQNINQRNKPLLLDGAMGSYLQQKGYETDDVLWTAKLNLIQSDAIRNIHKDYIDAGADIITTNTFRTNPTALLKSGINDLSVYVSEAVSLAKQATEGKKVLIAGSNPPAEDCYQRARALTNNQLEMNHKQHIDLLIDNGVDFILNETQSHLDEIKIICQHCDGNAIPYVLSLYLDEKLKLLSGESFEFIISFLKEHNSLAIGINCISPELFTRIVGSINLPENWGFYLNCGSGKPTDHIIHCGVSPDEYIKLVKESLQFHPSFIGACCGSSPKHIRKIRDFLDERYSS